MDPISEKDVERLKVIIAADKFRQEYAEKSFSQRHPELGRKFNCQICGHRHYKLHVCRQRIVRGFPTEGQTQLTRNQTVGNRFQKKRYNPHQSVKELQLARRANELFADYSPYFQDQDVAMKIARGSARSQLHQRGSAESKKRRRMQDVSRRINRGLLVGGSR